MNRSVIDYYINLWIDAEEGISKDAGWHGAGIAANLIDYKGFVPGGTNRAVHDNKMVIELQFLPEETPDLIKARKLIKWLRASNHYGDRCGERYFMALYTKNRYNNRQPIPGQPEELVITDFIRAAMCNVTRDDYITDIKKGYKLASAILEKLQENNKKRACA